MIEFQRLLLGDAIRNDAFAKALKKSIVLGETIVADIGSGTGFLSFVAERLGAKECHLYEMSDLLDLSKTIAKENGMKRCMFHKTHSTAVKNPPKADVVVSEILGNYALEENIIETLNDARRFLKPDGIVIPQELKQFVAPVTSSRLYDELNVWDDLGHELQYRSAKEVCMNNMYVKDVTPEDLELPSPRGRGAGGEGLLWDTVDFRTKNSSVREKSVDWTPNANITLYGFALWWESTLVPGVTLSTSPLSPPTHWKQIYLPVLDPLPVMKGQNILLLLHSDSRYAVKINLQWETQIRDAKGKALTTVKMDMRKGYIA